MAGADDFLPTAVWHQVNDAEAHMSVEVDYPHIERDAEGCARLSRVPRVRVAQIVMDYVAHGWSAEEMCRQHPYLKPAEIHAALAYYFDHQAEMDAEINAEWQDAVGSSGTHQSPFFLRMRASGKL